MKYEIEPNGHVRITDDGSNSSIQPNSNSNQNNKGNNRRHFGWIICIISIIVLILLIVLFRSCNSSQKSQQGHTDSGNTNNSSVDYSESVDRVSSISEEISFDSVDDSVIGKVSNYLGTNSLQILVDLYNTSIINHEGYEKVDSLIIEKINQIEDDYLNGNESYEGSSTDLKTLSGLSSEYLSGYAKKELNWEPHIQLRQYLVYSYSHIKLSSLSFHLTFSSSPYYVRQLFISCQTVPVLNDFFHPAVRNVLI